MSSNFCFLPGAFFIPYSLALLFLGLPLFLMELAIGQFSSEGPITVWKMNPLFSGIGYAMFLMSSIVGIYVSGLLPSLKKLVFGYCPGVILAPGVITHKKPAAFDTHSLSLLPPSFLNSTTSSWLGHSTFSTPRSRSNYRGAPVITPGTPWVSGFVFLIKRLFLSTPPVWVAVWKISVVHVLLISSLFGKTNQIYFQYFDSYTNT